jgi:hypothetical protein
MVAVKQAEDPATKQEARSKLIVEKFRERYGDDAAGMLRSYVNLDATMPRHPVGTAPRWKWRSIETTRVSSTNTMGFKV